MAASSIGVGAGVVAVVPRRARAGRGPGLGLVGQRRRLRAAADGREVLAEEGGGAAPREGGDESPGDAPSKERRVALAKDLLMDASRLDLKAIGKRPPPEVVFTAMRALEKGGARPDEFLAKLGGVRSPGRRWRLVFTTGTKDVQAALKGLAGSDLPGKGGNYFPIPAAQRFDAEAGEIENGVFLGAFAALTFRGPFRWRGKRALDFDFYSLGLRVGPFSTELDISKGKAGKGYEAFEPAKGGPSFSWAYVDDDIAVARGRGGGLAIWRRADSEFEMRNRLPAQGP